MRERGNSVGPLIFAGRPDCVVQELRHGRIAAIIVSAHNGDGAFPVTFMSFDDVDSSKARNHGRGPFELRLLPQSDRDLDHLVHGEFLFVMFAENGNLEHCFIHQIHRNQFLVAHFLFPHPRTSSQATLSRTFSICDSAFPMTLCHEES